MAKIAWQQVDDVSWIARVEGTGINAYAGQNDDGSFYWSCGTDGKCSAPIYTYQGISNPAAYIAAAIARCKADAESYLTNIV